MSEADAQRACDFGSFEIPLGNMRSRTRFATAVLITAGLWIVGAAASHRHDWPTRSVGSNIHHQ